VLGGICVNDGMEILWNRQSQTEWQDSLPKSACALQQSWAYGAAISSMGGRIERAEIVESGETICFVQIVAKRILGFVQIVLISRGPIWRDDVDIETRRAAISELRRNTPGQGVRFLLATPEQTMPRLIPLYTPCHMAEIALCKDVSVMRKGLHGKWRNALQKASQAKLRVSVSQDPGNRPIDTAFQFAV
jgi:hypothetical protein